MIVPCYDHCYLIHGMKYTEECDTNCDYAKSIKEANQIINLLLDMLEEEHMGMRAIAAKEIEEEFGVVL